LEECSQQDSDHMNGAQKFQNKSNTVDDDVVPHSQNANRLNEWDHSKPNTKTLKFARSIELEGHQGLSLEITNFSY
jgi:hypothetical protein